MRIRMEIVLLVLVLAIGAFYWNVALSTPIVFGDEGWYAAMAKYMISDGMIPKWNVVHSTDIFHFTFARPPLFSMLNIAALLMGGEFMLKLLLPLPIVLSAFMLFLLLRRLGKPVAGLIAAGALLLLPGIVTYGVMNYVETLAILFFTSSLYFADGAFRKGNKVETALSGIFAGLALLTDSSAFLLLPILVGYALFLRPMRFRQLLIVLVIAAVFLFPWIAHNVFYYGGHCLPLLPDVPGSCAPVFDIKLNETGPAEPPSAAQGGSSVNIAGMGLLSYSLFAFGWTAAALLIFGIVTLFTPGKERLLIGLWIIVFFMVTFWQANLGRAEDAVRATLFGFPALAAAAGLFASSAYDWLAAKGRWISIGLVALILLALLPYGYEKLVTMQSVKHGLDGLIDGCNWVKANTPEDSLIFAIYEHNVAWQCDRYATSSVPDRSAIRLTDVNTSYSHLKAHGFDYIMIEQFTIAEGPTDQTPAQFVNMLESSPQQFKKVYDNTGKWGQAGVRVFQVL